MDRQARWRVHAGCFVIVSALLATTPGVRFDSLAGGPVHRLESTSWGEYSQTFLSGPQASERGSGRISTGGIAFDPQNGNVYVTSSPVATTSTVGDVTAIDGLTNRAMDTASAGNEPGSLAFDPANGNLYVANQITVGSSGSVTVLAAGTLGTVATIPVGPTPQGVLYDPENSDVYVCNLDIKSLGGANTTSVIAGASDTVVGTIEVGCGSNDFGGNRMALDSSNGDLFIADTENPSIHDLWVFNTTTGAAAAPVRLPAQPSGILYDPMDNLLYATDGGNLTTISGSNGTIEDSFGVGPSPTALALDPSNGMLFVAHSSLHATNLTVVDTLTSRVVSSISVGQESNGIAYDHQNGCLYVDNLTGIVTVVNGSTYAVVGTISTQVAGGSAPAQSFLLSPDLEIVAGAGFVVLIITAIWWARRRRPLPPHS